MTLHYPSSSLVWNLHLQQVNILIIFAVTIKIDYLWDIRLCQQASSHLILSEGAMELGFISQQIIQQICIHALINTLG